MASQAPIRTIPFSHDSAFGESVIDSDATIRVLLSLMDSTEDTIMTLPVVCSLRDHFPDAFIGYVVEPKSTQVVQGHEAVDEVIELPRRWYASISGLMDARRSLRTHQFDCVIDCQGNAKSALAGYLSGASRRIGLATASYSDWSQKIRFGLTGWLHNEKVIPVFHHVTDRSLELLTPLGIHHPLVRWDFPVDHTDQVWAGEYRRKIHSAHIAIVDPGGDWPSKRWETDRYASTSRYLADRYGYHTLVIWNTFDERLLAEEIVSLSEGTASLAPSTSLRTIAALIQTADLFLGGDSAALHLSVALGISTVGLYGATRPDTSGPYHQTALQIRYEEGSRRHRRRADNRAMRDIGVEHVCSAIDQLHAARGVRAA
jgi:ADP-heptose:LPS heptosyltransferase